MFKLEKNFYQNDPRWQNVYLGNSSETIGSWGSLLTSIAMMLTGIGYPEETPVTVNEKMKKAGGFLKALPGPPYVAYVWPNCIYRGITRCENSNAPIAKIDAAVAAGKPVILQVDSSKRMGIQTHFVLVKDKKGNDYVLYDPFRDKGDGLDKEVLLTQRYKYNGGTLQKEISAVLWFDFDKAELPAPPPRSEPTKVPKEKYAIYAAQERLVLRAGPSVDDYPRKCLFMGTELTSLEPKETVDTNLGVKGQWIQVQDPKGEQGYVSAAFVTSNLSTLLPPTEAAAQPSRKKYCLKKVSVQQLVVEMRPCSEPDNATKYQGVKPDKSFETLPQYTVVNILKSDKTMAGLTKILYQETYYNYKVKDWVIARVTGWVNEAELDDYREDEQEEFRKSIRVDIPKETQTESSTDGQQDFYIDKEKKKARYNMCGELSVAFISGQTIDVVLNTWRDDPASRSTYDSMVGNADKPLEVSHIENLFRLQKVDYEPYKYDRQGNARKDYISLADKDGDRRLASEELEARLKDYYFITNLKIDTRTGDLEPAQSAEERNHWVVLDRVTRDRSRIELYNPFPNRLEEYSFGEFYRSVNGDPNSGWWIKKEVRLAALGQKTNGASASGGKKVAMPLRAETEFRPPMFEVGIDNQTEYDKDAEQYLYIRGEGSRPKTNLCGEFCVSFILGQSLESSLKHWIETQGKQAGLWELATLLQAYGFNRRKYVKPLNATERDPGKYYVTPNNKLGIPSDPKQYFKSFSIDTVLEYWKGVQPDLFNSILGGNRNEKTGPDDLITILKAYGYSRDDFSYYRPGSQENFGYAPARDAEVVGKTYFVLAGVNINGTTGRLQHAGVAHWVVVTKVTPRGNLVGGNGGWVELYNPFPNCWEEYSYKEFMDSFAPGSTLWIKKDISPVLTQQVIAPPQSKEKAPSKNLKGNQNLKSGQKGAKKGQREQGKNKRKNAGLPPIDDNPPLDVNRVVCERLEVKAIPWEIGEWIHQTADGDEYFAGELAETLCESGILDLREVEVGENKKIQAAVLTDPEFSENLERAIQTNMKRLASSPRSWDPALKVASALLPLFTRTAIQEIKEIRKNMPPQAYQSLDEFRAWTLGLASKGTDPLEEDIKKNLEPLISKPDQTKIIRVCHTLLTCPTSGAFEEEVKKIHSDSKTVAKIKKLWKIKSQQKISPAEVREWARGLTSPPRKNIYRVRRWGDPEMSDLGFDTSILEERDQSSNFQAVALYNEATEFGAISNYLIIPPEDVLRLEALQVEDEYETKRGDDWLHQKMNWLCQFRGSIYMFADENSYKGEWDWRRREGIRWGTLALGGNLVQVLGTHTFPVKLPGKDKAQPIEMARLEGFRPKDWDRPLDELLAEGLVHRCFCVYQGNDLGDSPKGIVYSPFWSPECWQFMPKPKRGSPPKSLWIPCAYLEGWPKETETNPQSNSG